MANDIGRLPNGTGLSSASQIEPASPSRPKASIPSAWWPVRVRLKAGRAIGDPEKLVTPGIIYAAQRGNGLAVHLVAVGWWDWHVSLLLALPHREKSDA